MSPPVREVSNNQNLTGRCRRCLLSHIFMTQENSVICHPCCQKHGEVCASARETVVITSQQNSVFVGSQGDSGRRGPRSSPAQRPAQGGVSSGIRPGCLGLWSALENLHGWRSHDLSGHPGLALHAMAWVLPENGCSMQ